MSYGELSNTQETMVMPLLQMKNIRGKPYITVSAKGMINGLSNIPNDGADFGPDTTKGATSRGQYGSPYTETSGIQESYDYAETNDIASIYLSAGVFLINAQITPKSNVNLIGNGGLWNPATVAYPLPASDVPSNLTVIRVPSTYDSSNFPQTSLFYGSGSINGLLFQNFTIDFQGEALNGININATVGASGQQNSAWFINVSLMNLDSSNTGIAVSGSNEINNIFMNCQFIGQGTSINSSNTGSLIWLYNVQDYTTGGMSFNNVYVYIVGGIQQRVSLNNCMILSIVDGSFTNANAPDGIAIGSAVEMIVLENTGILIPSSSFINTGNGAHTISSFTMKNCTIDTSINTTFIDSVPAIKKWVDEDNVLITSALPTNFPFSFLPTPVSGHLLSSKANNATLTANPPVSGTVYQNTNPYDIEIDLPVYATTSGTAGYVTVAKGSTSTPTAIGNQYVSGDTSATSEQIIRLRVPANWYYEFTASLVTFGTASVFAD